MSFINKKYKPLPAIVIPLAMPLFLLKYNDTCQIDGKNVAPMKRPKFRTKAQQNIA